jgi:hypothetical protein
LCHIVNVGSRILFLLFCLQVYEGELLTDMFNVKYILNLKLQFLMGKNNFMSVL